MSRMSIRGALNLLLLSLLVPGGAAAQESATMAQDAEALARVSADLRRTVEAPEGPWCASADTATIRMLRSEAQALDQMAGRFRHHLQMGQTTELETHRTLERMNRHAESIRDQLAGFASHAPLDGSYQRASRLLRRINTGYYREPDVFRQQPGGRWLDHPLDQARIAERGLGRGGLFGCAVCGRLGACAHTRAHRPPPPTAPPGNTFIDPGIRQIEYRQDGSIEIRGPAPVLDPGLMPLAPEPSLESQRERRARFEKMFPD